MWHCFILFTKDYADFCQKYFGYYIHHLPFTRDDKAKFARMSDEEKVLALSKMFDLIQNILGSKTLLDWTEKQKLRKDASFV
jgi:hypothetical protein